MKLVLFEITSNLSNARVFHKLPLTMPYIRRLQQPQLIPRKEDKLQQQIVRPPRDYFTRMALIKRPVLTYYC